MKKQTISQEILQDPDIIALRNVLSGQVIPVSNHSRSQILPSNSNHQLCIMKTSMSDYSLLTFCQENSSSQYIKALHMYMGKITSYGMFYFGRQKWSNLTTLDLSRNLIADQGCKYLTRAYMEKLKTINLNNNKFETIACLHLSKARWPNLTQLQLRSAGLRKTSHLVKLNSKKLSKLDIHDNSLQVRQIFTLIFYPFPSLKELPIKQTVEKVVIGGVWYAISEDASIQWKKDKKWALFRQKFPKIRFDVNFA